MSAKAKAVDDDGTGSSRPNEPSASLRVTQPLEEWRHFSHGAFLVAAKPDSTEIHIIITAITVVAAAAQLTRETIQQTGDLSSFTRVQESESYEQNSSSEQEYPRSVARASSFPLRLNYVLGSLPRPLTARSVGSLHHSSARGRHRPPSLRILRSPSSPTNHTIF